MEGIINLVESEETRRAEKAQSQVRVCLHYEYGAFSTVNRRDSPSKFLCSRFIRIIASQHDSEREEIRNRNLEGINELRINLENKIEELEKQFDDAHMNYVENTDDANREFKEMQGEDKRNSQKIASKKRKIERFQQNLQFWKKKIDLNQAECAARNKALREQKMAILKHCNELKVCMPVFRVHQQRIVTHEG